MGLLVRRARAIWRVLWRSSQLDRDMQDEMRFHLQMEAERLAQARGLDPDEARRQASIRFGGVEKSKEQGREVSGLHWLDGASLDARLGVRMLVKHRWLTLVGGVAMTVAIAIGATTFEVINDLLDPTLPFPHRRSGCRGEICRAEDRRGRLPRAARVRRVARSSHHARAGGRLPHD